MSALPSFRIVVAIVFLAASCVASRAELPPIRTYTPADGLPSYEVEGVEADSRGFVWLYMADGIARFDGYTFTTYTVADGLPSRHVTTFLETRSGGYYAATCAGLARFDPSGVRGSERPPFVGISLGDGQHDNEINDFVETRDGSFACATNGGLFHVDTDARVTRDEVWGHTPALSVYEDASSVWVGSYGGLRRLRLDGSVETYSMAASFLNSGVQRMSAGDLVVTMYGKGRVVHRFDGTRFAPVEPALPPGLVNQGWGWGQTVVEARDGTWWMPSESGALHYPRAHDIESSIRGKPELVAYGSMIYRLYEDKLGGIWIATTQPRGLLRWDPETKHVTDFTDVLDVDSNTDLTAFAETRGGALWIATSTAGLFRYANGRFERFADDCGAPSDFLRSLHVDASGRMWVASNMSGLIRIDDPDAERPTCTRYTTADGLTSENVYCVTSDKWGRIYVGLPLGVDRLDPVTGRVVHHSTDDGLPPGAVNIAYCDRRGQLWFGSKFGLARLVPAPDRERAPARAVVTGLRVAGIGRPVSALGEGSVGELELGPSENSVGVDFLGIGTSLGEQLRYQYRLEGGAADWSAPSTERTVTFANLAPDSYRLLIRALDADGRMSAEPASVAFTVAAPVWRRWWFVVHAIGLGLAAGSALYRNRVARILELERVRARIASDLHDDIGSNLTKIAVLSEVANFRLGPNAGEGSLAEIADISLESVAAMNDIVWSVKPGQDASRDLARRMRGFASDAFEPCDVDARFDAPDTTEAALDDELRRNGYLIFKEAVSDAVRHSGCSSVAVSLSVDRRELRLTIADDGRGFDLTSEADGDGLANMRKRAKSVGGTLDMSAPVGRGTTITLTVPLNRGRSVPSHPTRSSERNGGGPSR